MSIRVPQIRPGAPGPDDVPPQDGSRSDPADSAPDATPSEQRATATWVEATDASGTVRSKREMPEPDSPGG